MAMITETTACLVRIYSHGEVVVYMLELCRLHTCGPDNLGLMSSDSRSRPKGIMTETVQAQGRELRGLRLVTNHHSLPIQKIHTHRGHVSIDTSPRVNIMEHHATRASIKAAMDIK
jgi:hypothetical protein